MKASELIRILQVTIQGCGDVEVRHSLGAFGEAALHDHEVLIDTRYIGDGEFENVLVIDHPMFEQVSKMDEIRKRLLARALKV